MRMILVVLAVLFVTTAWGNETDGTASCSQEPSAGAVVNAAVQGASVTSETSRAEWMSGRFGVMVHWLFPNGGTKPDPRMMGENAFGHSTRYVDEPVDAFDLEGFLADVDRSGAQWVIFTVGQNRCAWASPNAVINRRIGKGFCSKRDLVLEMGQALHARGKRLIAYLPMDCMHPTLQGPFAWIRDDSPDWKEDAYGREEYLRRWAEVIREWSVRWGRFCDGWFFDGTHHGRFPTGVDGEIVRAAVAAGNPDAAISFNFGVPLRMKAGEAPKGLLQYAGSDYLACEIGAIYRSKVLISLPKDPEELWMPKSKTIPGTTCLYHSLFPIDGFWGGFNPYPPKGSWLRAEFHETRPEMCDQAALTRMREAGEWPAPVYAEEQLGRFLRDFTSVGGGVTLNVGINERGRLNPKSVKLLERICATQQ